MAVRGAKPPGRPAVAALRKVEDVPDHLLAHLSPLVTSRRSSVKRPVFLVCTLYVKSERFVSSGPVRHPGFWPCYHRLWRQLKQTFME